MKKNTEREYFAFRKIPNTLTGYAGLGNKLMPSVYEGVGLPLEGVTLETNREQIDKDIGRTSFFYDVVSPPDIPNITQTLINNGGNAYIQGEFDGGLAGLTLQTVFLQEMLESGTIIERDMEEYLETIRVVYTDENGVLSSLGVAWMKDNPLTMIICITKNLNDPATLRPCAFFVSDTALNMMNNTAQFGEVAEELKEAEPVPDDHLSDQLTLIINQQVVTDKLTQLLAGKKINIPIIGAVSSTEGYQAGTESILESYQLMVSKNQALIPAKESSKPFVNANTLMQKTFYASMRDSTPGTDIEQIRRTAFAVFLEEVANQLSQINPTSPKPGWVQRFQELKSSWKTEKVDVGKTLAMLNSCSNLLKEGKINSALAIENSEQGLKLLQNVPHLKEAASDFLTELLWLEKNANEMYDTHETIVHTPKT